MKKSAFIAGFLLLACFAFFASVPVSAENAQVTVSYSFERPEISSISAGSQTYDRITLMGAPNSSIAGQPALPEKGARILIPYGSEVADIKIITGEKIELGTNFHVSPG